MPTPDQSELLAKYQGYLDSIPEGKSTPVALPADQIPSFMSDMRRFGRLLGLSISVMNAGNNAIVYWQHKEPKQPSEEDNKRRGAPDITPASPGQREELANSEDQTLGTNPLQPIGRERFEKINQASTTQENSKTSERRPVYGLTGVVGKDGILTPEQQDRLDEIQMAAVEATTVYQRYKEPAELSPLVHMATGIGKGKIIYEAVSQQLSEDPSKPVLVIIGTRDHLRDQMEKAIGRYQQTDRENIARVESQLQSNLRDELEDDENDQETEEDKAAAAAVEAELIEEDAFKGFTFGKYGTKGVNIQLSTIQTLQAAVKRGDFDPTQYGMVIVDEVHNLGTRQRKSVVTACQQQGIPVVGLTATAYRNSGSMRTPEQYGFTTVITYPLPEAQGEHLLPTLYGLPFQTAEILGDTPIPRKENGKIDYDALETILKDHPELRSYIVDKLVPIITHNGNRYKTIIPVNYVWEAQEYAELLKASGISVGLLINQSAAKEIHTEEIPTLDTLRRYALSQDDPESIQVLISPNLAGEGFDAPWTEVLCWGSPTDSDLRYTQYVGRLARRHPGKAWALVIDPLYHLDQFTWSMNMAQWMKDNVRQLENGLLYLGPLQEVQNITILLEMYQMIDPVDLSDLQKSETRKIPNGWLVIGEKEYSGTLANVLDRTASWILPRIPQAITNIERRWDELGISAQEREVLFDRYTGGNNQLTFYYSPLILEELKKMVDEELYPPEGWLSKGSNNSANTLLGVVGRGYAWIDYHLGKVLEEIEREWEEKKIPLSERPQIFGSFMDSGGRLRIYYAPLVLKKLKERNIEENAPVGWLIVGDKRIKNSLASSLDRDAIWVLSRIKLAVNNITKEWDEQCVSTDEREKLFGNYLNNQDHLLPYYSPLILEELKKMVDEELYPPEGWLHIGEREDSRSLVELLDRTKPWIQSRMPIAIANIKKRWDEDNIPTEERDKLSGEYRRIRVKTLFYSPLVQEELKKMADEEVPPPSDWLAIGNKDIPNSLSGILQKTGQWIKAHLPEAIIMLKQQEGSNFNVGQLYGEYNGKGGKTTYYSPRLLEVLKIIEGK